MKIKHDSLPGRASDSLTLILMRHAKSDWSSGEQADFDRPLNPRGVRDAPRIAQWLQDQSLIPDRILASAAKRTRQSAQAMLDHWNSDEVLMTSNSLYLADPETILKSIQSDGGDANVLMVLAHNPGISYLASTLADQLIDLPTAALAVFKTTVDHWQDFRIGQSLHLIHSMKPKTL